MNKNDYIFNEFIGLNPTEFSFVIENAKFTCLIDSNFETLHQSPSMQQFDQLHFHNYYELFYISDGSLKIKFEDSEKILSKDDLVIISPGILHRSFRNSEDVIRYNIKFFIDENPAVTDYPLYDALKKLFSGKIFAIEKDSSFHPILKSISDSIHSNDKPGLPLAFHEMIYHFLSSTKNEKATVSSKATDSQTSRIYKIHHIITMHYMDDISLKYIAENMFLSTRQVNRIIQKHYGCTFSELITKLRLNASANFLASTNMKILEIAHRVGYKSLYGFYSAFKKQFGCLPLAYRKSHTQPGMD